MTGIAGIVSANRPIHTTIRPKRGDTLSCKTTFYVYGKYISQSAKTGHCIRALSISRFIICNSALFCYFCSAFRGTF